MASPRAFRCALLALLSLVLVFVAPTAAVAASQSHAVELTSDNFEELTADGDWLIEFYAPWCGHCKRLEPAYETVAFELRGTMNVGKVDTSEHYDLRKQFDVSALPYIVLVTQDQNMHVYSGRRTAPELVQFARGGYKETAALAIPPPYSLIAEITHDLSVLRDKIEATPASVLVTMFTSGLLVGALLMWLVSMPTSVATVATAPATTKAKTN